MKYIYTDVYPVMCMGIQWCFYSQMLQSESQIIFCKTSLLFCNSTSSDIIAVAIFSAWAQTRPIPRILEQIKLMNQRTTECMYIICLFNLYMNKLLYKLSVLIFYFLFYRLNDGCYQFISYTSNTNYLLILKISFLLRLSCTFKIFVLRYGPI